MGHCLVFRIAAQCQPRHGAEREGDYTQHTTQPPRNEQRHSLNTPRLASGGNAKCHFEDLNLDSTLTFQRTFFITDQTNYLLQLFICFLCLGEIVKLRQLMTTRSVIIIIKLSASYFTFHRVSMFHVREELWRKGGDEENGVSRKHFSQVQATRSLAQRRI